MTQHSVLFFPAIREGHIPQSDTAAGEAGGLGRLGQLLQIQQMPSVPDGKFHALHGIEKGCSLHQRGHDTQHQHQAQSQPGRVQDAGLIQGDPNWQGGQQRGRQDRQAQVHGLPGAAEPIQREVTKTGHCPDEFLIGGAALVESLYHLDALYILHDDTVDLSIGCHIGGILFVVGPQARRHGDQRGRDRSKGGKAHPPIHGKEGDHHHDRQQHIGTQFRYHVGQRRLNVLDPIHDGAFEGTDGLRQHTPQGGVHQLMGHLTAQALQNGVGRHMSQHSRKGVKSHLDRISRQTHSSPSEKLRSGGRLMDKQAKDLIDPQIRHKAPHHADNCAYNRQDQLSPAGTGKGEQDGQPAALFHKTTPFKK